jgi:uncharacterized protein
MEQTLKTKVVAVLQALKPELAARYRVKSLELFGSVARDEQQAESDIDLLVEFSENADMFDLVGLGLFLEERLQRQVDVVPKKSLRAELQAAVLAEAIVV